MMHQIDQTDRQVIATLIAHPRASVTQLAHECGIARGTVYSRLERLERWGVITGYGPQVDARAAGFGVLGFCTVEIAQGSHAATMKALAAISEILEIHTITGEGDLLLRVIAQSNDHLHEVLQQVTALPTVRRTQTQLALASSVNRTVAELVSSV